MEQALIELSRIQFTSWTFGIIKFWLVTIALIVLFGTLIAATCNREMRRLRCNRQRRNLSC